jgi:hypothetical protein
MRKIKPLFYYVFFPISIWCGLFLILVSLIKKPIIPYLAVFFGITVLLIFIVGPVRGNLLRKDNPGYKSSRMVFFIGVISLLFAGWVLLVMVPW